MNIRFSRMANELAVAAVRERLLGLTWATLARGCELGLDHARVDFRVKPVRVRWQEVDGEFTNVDAFGASVPKDDAYRYGYQFAFLDINLAPVFYSFPHPYAKTTSLLYPGMSAHQAAGSIKVGTGGIRL